MQKLLVQFLTKNDDDLSVNIASIRKFIESQRVIFYFVNFNKHQKPHTHNSLKSS